MTAIFSHVVRDRRFTLVNTPTGRHIAQYKSGRLAGSADFFAPATT